MNKLFSIVSVASVVLLSVGFAAKATAQATSDDPSLQDAIVTSEERTQSPTDNVSWFDRQNDGDGDRAALPARSLPATETSQWVEADGWRVLDDGTIVLGSGAGRVPQFTFYTDCGGSHVAQQ